MNFVSFYVQNLKSDLQLISATMWRGENIGGDHDNMQCFFASSGRCPEDAPADLHFAHSTYYCEVMDGKDELFRAFAQWLKDQADDAIIVVDDDDYQVLLSMADEGLVELSEFDCIVDISMIWPLMDRSSYAKRHGIRPCRAMAEEGGKPIWLTAMKAMCYRHLLSAVGLHEYPAKDIKILQECHGLAGLV